MSGEDIRPRGTVEVTCKCGVSFWVDALNPALPNGPFVCGICNPNTAAEIQRDLMTREPPAPPEPMFRFTITLECACGNAARYLNERGQFCCATCPLKQGIDSIKLADVPKLLAWARAWSEREPDYADPMVFREQAKLGIRELRDILPRAPKTFRELIDENRAEGGCGCAPGTVLCPH